MAEEIRCMACGGPLGWAGSQMSCRDCGKVHTIEGKPGSKLAMLIVGVSIGCVLGFIAAYELIRFVPSIQPSASHSNPVDVSDDVETPEPVPEQKKPPAVQPVTLSHFVEPEVYASLMGVGLEAVDGAVLAESATPNVSFELHSTRVLNEDSTWIYGRTTNLSPVTVDSVKGFVLKKDQKGKVTFQDEFYSTHDCLAPGQSRWSIGLIDTNDPDGFTVELYPEAASRCRYPAVGLEVEYDIRGDNNQKTVYGSVTNGGKWGVQFAQVYVYQFSEEEERKLIGHGSSYLRGTLAPGASQRFEVNLFGEASETIEVNVTGRPTDE